MDSGPNGARKRCADQNNSGRFVAERTVFLLGVIFFGIRGSFALSSGVPRHRHQTISVMKLSGPQAMLSAMLNPTMSRFRRY